MKTGKNDRLGTDLLHEIDMPSEELHLAVTAYDVARMLDGDVASWGGVIPGVKLKMTAEFVGEGCDD